MADRRNFLVICGVTLIALAFCVIVNAQVGNRNYIKGVVSSASKPARSVWVIISQNGVEKRRSLTGDDGKYYLGPLTSGTYDILVQKGNSRLSRGRVSIPSNSDFDIKI